LPGPRPDHQATERVPAPRSAAPPPDPYAVELHGITKRFPGVVANKDIELSVRRGTVHAWCGENGAGKSTLMKILYGVQQPDEGTITVNGQGRPQLPDRRDQGRHRDGLPALHARRQPHRLENVVLGAEKLHGIGGRRPRRDPRISKEYGLDVDPDDLVADLGVGARQRVEILKVLYRGAKILILDEPTAVLVPQEVAELFDNLRELKAEGLTVMFISHKLDEVLSVADDITVIRRGTTVATVDPKTVTARQLAELMVGSELPSPSTEESTVTDRRSSPSKASTWPGPPGSARCWTTSTSTIHAGEDRRHRWRRGQWPGRTGRGHHGDARAHLRQVILLENTDISDWQVREIREAGVGYIPEDRHRHGLLLEAPLWENRHPRPPDPGPQRQGPAHRRQGGQGRHRGDRQGLRRAHPVDLRHRRLALRRQPAEAHRRPRDEPRPKVLIAAHPTRGVDVGAQASIWDLIKKARREGLAVLLISRRPRGTRRAVRHHPGHPPRRPVRAVRPRCRDQKTWARR
jgi:ABC-type uncharacterized transport system ATPase subunit